MFRSSVRVLALLYLPAVVALIKGEITMNTNKAFWAVVSVVAVCSVLVCGKVYTDRSSAAAASEMALKLLEVAPEEVVATVDPEVSIETAPQESAYEAVRKAYVDSYIESFKVSFFDKTHRLPSDELAAELAAASFEETMNFHYGKDVAKGFASNSPQWARMAVMPLGLQLSLKAITAEATIKYAKAGKVFAN